jgi:hypothetical protein
MTTTERGTAVSFLDPPRPLRLRRAGALRVLLQPRRAAQLLDGLAAAADLNRVAAGVVIKACAHAHYDPGWRSPDR